jgi:hypothetical protein
MEGKDTLDDLVELARDRIDGLIRAAHERDLWAEVLDLISHLSLENRAQLGDIAAAQDIEVIDALIRAVYQLDAWDTLLPVTAAMSDESLRRFASAPALQDPKVLQTVIGAAVEQPGLLRAAMDRAAELEGLDEFAALLGEQTPDPVWAAFVELRAEMPATVRKVVAARASQAGRKDVARALKRRD